MKSSTALKELLVIAALLVTGCRTSMSRGMAAYHDGYYPEAVEALASAHAQHVDAEPASRARFALYFGLAHLALGHLPEAQRWVAEAKWLWDADGSVLETADAGRLLSAWEALGHTRGEGGDQELARSR